MATPAGQQPPPQGRWLSVCLAAAAGTALGAGAFLYYRSQRESAHPAPAKRHTATSPTTDATDAPQPHAQQQAQQQSQQQSQQQAQQPVQPQHDSASSVPAAQRQPSQALSDISAGSTGGGRLTLLQELALLNAGGKAGSADAGNANGGGGFGHHARCALDADSAAKTATHDSNPAAWNEVLDDGPIPEAALAGLRARQGREAAASSSAAALPDGQFPLEALKLCRLPDGSPHLLGRGSFGKVYQARLGDELVAVKVFELQKDIREKVETSFRAEVMLLRACTDPNVVAFRGAAMAPNHMLMVMELCPGGDLRKALTADVDGHLRWYMRDRSSGGGKREGLGRVIALDIARGLAFLHAHHIIHLDLKSPNVLLGPSGEAKIGDVGLARFMPHDYMSAQAAVGTFAWSAPEMLMGERCSQKVDVFALGVILWELVTGESPTRSRMRPVRVPEDCPSGVRDLISQCMEARGALRPSAAEVAQLLAEPAALQQPLPPRRAPDGLQADSSTRSVRERLREKHWAMALAVHGSEQAAADAGCQSLVLEQALENADLALYCAYISRVKDCLGDPAVEDAASAVHQRLLRMVAAFRDLVSLHMRESTRIVMESRFANLETLRDINALAEQLASSPFSSSDGSGGASSAASDHAGNSQAGARGKVKDEDGSKQRVESILEAIRLTPQQEAAILQERRRVDDEMDALRAERKRLVLRLRDTTSGDDGSGGGYLGALEASKALRANMEAESRLATEYQLWFTCQLLAPLQHARCDCAAWPFPPDPMLIGDAIASAARSQ